MKKCLFVIAACITANGYCQYNFYFGNLHSHSSYSDGNKDSLISGYYTPADNFSYAKGSYHIDFWGVSEHNHYSSTNNPGMHVADYAKGLYQADTSNVNGSFVSLYGFEWGVISNGGHVVTYGVPDLIGWETLTSPPGNNYNRFCAKSDYTSFWPIVNAYAKGFCTLAHPSSGDYGDLTGAAPYSSTADAAIAGTAMRSGNAFSVTTNYSDPAPTLYEGVYMAALAKGYHLGPVMDHDNHYTTFGRTNQIRTVVLATVLHRDSILSAYKAGRFYASDDWNAKVTFTVNGNYMGSDITTGANASIYVSVADDDAGDNVSSVQLYYGVPGSGSNATVLTSSTTATLNYIHTTTLGSKYYYYAKITQADGNIIWTSPVWVFRNAVTLPVELVSFTGRYANAACLLNWSTASETGNSHFVVERSADGRSFTAIGAVPSHYTGGNTLTAYTFTDGHPVNGHNFYRLQQVDKDGNYSYSAIVLVDATAAFVQGLKVNPNPVTSNLVAQFTAAGNELLTVKVYTAEGREVLVSHYNCAAGDNRLLLQTVQLSRGTYFLVLSRPNQRVGEARFVKQ
jgi:trimeric autotransporter adhesin